MPTRIGLQLLGYDAHLAVIRSRETAALELETMLDEGDFDVVMFGAGVRKSDDRFLLFERLVNVVHERAPKAKIAFDTGPTDTTAAVQRWS